MFKDEYRRRQDAIHADEALIRRTLDAADAHNARHAAGWKPALIAALCVLLVTVPVLTKLLHEHKPTVLDDQPTPTIPPVLNDVSGDQQGVVLQYISSADMGGTTCMWLSAEGPEVHADMRITLTLTADQTGETCRLSAAASMFDETARRASFLVPLIDADSGSSFAIAGGDAVTLTLDSWTNAPQIQSDGSTLYAKTICSDPQALHFRMGGVGEQKVCDGYVYSILADGTVQLDMLLWTSASMSVPAELDGRRVSSVGTAFAYNEQIEQITLPEGIKVIGINAFVSCENLKEVNLPEGLLEIGPVSFAGCSALKSIHIPDSVTTIGHEAFAWCTSLKEVHLPASLTEIGFSAFGHAALSYVDVPDGLTSLPDQVFSSTIAQPAYASIPASVTEIDPTAFQWGVGKLIVEPGSFAETFARVMGYEYEYAAGFEPAVRYINGDWAYTVQPDGTAKLDSYTGSDTQIRVPDSLGGHKVSSVGLCFTNNDTITSIILPDGLETVSSFAFYKCYSLELVVLPQSLRRIEESAFHSCIGLTMMTIPSSVEEIAPDAFYRPEKFSATGGFYDAVPVYPITLLVTPGSYAESYADENGLPFKVLEER